MIVLFSEISSEVIKIIPNDMMINIYDASLTESSVVKLNVNYFLLFR